MIIEMPNIRIEQTAAVVTVLLGVRYGVKQGKNPCQPGLWPDASAAHPARSASLLILQRY
jgi:hypothetical protein